MKLSVYGLVAASSDDWAVAHNSAVMDYVQQRTVKMEHDYEQAILRMADAVSQYVNAYVRENELPFDYVLGPYLGAILNAIIGLLVGNVGRLEAGTVDSWCRMMAERIGWDLDTEEMR